MFLNINSLNNETLPLMCEFAQQAKGIPLITAETVVNSKASPEKILSEVKQAGMFNINQSPGLANLQVETFGTNIVHQVPGPSRYNIRELRVGNEDRVQLLEI